MSAIILVDTTVFLNVLRVPSKSGSRDAVMTQLGQHIEARNQLLLPMATVLETGNHVAQNGDGNERRRCANEFVDIIRHAARENIPWSLVPLPDEDELSAWLDRFPDSAMAGVGLGDISIIHTFERMCSQFRGWRVTVWSLDSHLQGYDRVPSV